MVYVDTSALVPYYCAEPLSEKVEKILINTKELAICPLTGVELASALARKIRERSLSQESGNAILSLFD